MPPFVLSLPPNRVRRNYTGGLLLDEWEGVAHPADSDRPEDWVASTVQARNPGLPPIEAEGLATVQDDQGECAPLLSLFERDPLHWLGKRHVEKLGTQLGFLAKLLDSAIRLHVQGHPTAAFAQKYLHSRWGKLETYVILGVRSGHTGILRLGFQKELDAAEWERIVLTQDIAAMDACFEPIPVTPGEVWVVPGGLPHAIGAGLFVLEVMEPTDLVVRCEFEREGIVVPPEARFMGRDPQFALQIFDLTPQTPTEIRERCCITPHTFSATAAMTYEQLIGPAQTDCFTIHRTQCSTGHAIPSAGTIRVGVVTRGHGRVQASGDAMQLYPGQKFLLASAAEDATVHPGAENSLEILWIAPQLNAQGDHA